MTGKTEGLNGLIHTHSVLIHFGAKRDGTFVPNSELTALCRSCREYVPIWLVHTEGKTNKYFSWATRNTGKRRYNSQSTSFHGCAVDTGWCKHELCKLAAQHVCHNDEGWMPKHYVHLKKSLLPARKTNNNSALPNLSDHYCQPYSWRKWEKSLLQF